MRYFLGIDGGGTKTATLILDEQGKAIGAGVGGSGNLANTNDLTLRRSVRDSVKDAIQQSGLPPDIRFAGVCAGMAGYSAADRREAFEGFLKATFPSERHCVEPDYVTAYWGAAEGEPGIIVIAGTGAVSFGRNEAGATCKEDGLGFLLGDRGSGFNLGIRVLRHTLETMKASQIDPLSQTVLTHLEAKTQGDILQWLYGNFSPARVATLAPIVGELAECGDEIAKGHLAEMARHLRHAVRQVRHTLLLPREVPVYPLGGLWNLGSFFQTEFVDPQWRGSDNVVVAPEGLPGGRFQIGTPKHDASFGAAVMARLNFEVF